MAINLDNIIIDRIGWKDDPDTSTPLDSGNLKEMENNSEAGINKLKSNVQIALTELESKTNKLNTEIDNLKKYSTEEVKTGETWIDGKPIYRKVISCGALPNSTSKFVNHNISDIDNSRIYGFAVRTSDKREFPLPFSSADSNGNVQLDLTSTQIQITTNVDRSSFNTSYVILEYTKTTD